ncbi:protein O-mannosyl-transferase TMTC4 isoform X2 [Gambusia affinis]|uniref:protein O-mannosyl-transferase TMTC4 isoform X2 n=1 Tax=Gambusia affinis TaxID=33528 RepID=UPI001CDC015C|nr:protein O-mannosyl-transferase TMTC4 isoform X2 [Gambusia affinis]
MAQTELCWDRHVPLPKLGPVQAKVTVAVVALLCFINSYDGEFVFDDSEAIVNNKDLKPTTPLSNIWRNDFWGSNLSSNSSHKSYRPLTVLTFRLNYLIAGGLHPVGFHVLNIILHAVISVLMIDVFAILIGGLDYDVKGWTVNRAPKTSLLAAIFFAAHPVHTESVAGVVGRADLLCALFFQLSFLTYCKAFNKGNDRDARFSVQWVVVSLVLCAAAMLCKEQGITVLGVNAAFDVLLICNVNVYELGHRILFRKNSPGIVNYNYYYCLNAWLLLCPWWLCFDWSMGCVPLIKSATDWRVVWLLLLWCVLIGLISQALCSPDSQRRRTLTLGLVLLVVPFLPACNIFFRVGFVVAERVLYLSSAGYCLLLAYSLGHCCYRWIKYKKLTCVMLLALLCMYVVRCALRSHQWRSEQSLFSSALSVCPLNAKVHYNVGKNLADRGNTTTAVKYYREAVRLHPNYVHAMNNLGNILKEQNELSEAEQLLSKAVAVQPDFAAAWMNLGIVQNSLRKFDAAEESYWNALRYRRKYPDCYYNLGRLYADQNRHVDALNAWRNATMLKPDHSLAWNNMVILLDNTGNLGQAELIGREALKLLPNDHTIMFSLANVLGKLQKYKESESFFLHALRIKPNAASCHGNLAVLYHRWGKLELAKKHYELSLKLDPEAPGTRDNYNMLRRKLDQLKHSAP